MYLCLYGDKRNTSMPNKINKIFKWTYSADFLNDNALFSKMLPKSIMNDFIKEFNTHFKYYSSAYNKSFKYKERYYLDDNNNEQSTYDLSIYFNYTEISAEKLHNYISQSLLIISTSKEEFLNKYQSYNSQFKVLIAS